jgi:putative membrane protein
MKYAVMIGTLALGMAAMPALAQQPNPTSRPATQPDTHKAGTMKAGSDDHFIMETANASMAEVELGKLASDKASNAEVKKFGERMVDDHGKANDELKTLAQNKNVTLPSTIDAKHKAVMDKLSKLSGEQFDKAYVQEMVKGHQQVAASFRTESKSGKDADVKAWAAKTLPTIEEHLKMAQELSKSAVGTSGTKK